MAIQFNCPYCTATIRVADTLAGKQGRCPKCDTRLLVPLVERPPQATEEAAGTSLADTAAGLKGSADQTSVGMHALETVPGGVPEFAPVAPTASVTTRLRRRQRKSRRNRILMAGIPAVCFLLLIGALALVMTSSLPDLSGTLTGTLQQTPVVPTRTFPWTATGLPAEDRQLLQQALEKAPDGFISDVMTCHFVAGSKGLEVQLKAGEGFAWCVVDPTQSRALVLWAQKHQQSLNQTRTHEMQAQVAAYSREKRQIAAGEPVRLDAQSFRDSIGLNTHTMALGYALEAIAAGRSLRCAHEDDQGRLYFLVPRDTRSFQIKGRLIADGTRPFPGDYMVTVAPAASTDAASPSSDQPVQPPDPAADGADDAASDTQMPDSSDANPGTMQPDAPAMPEKMNL